MEVSNVGVEDRQHRKGGKWEVTECLLGVLFSVLNWIAAINE